MPEEPENPLPAAALPQAPQPTSHRARRGKQADRGERDTSTRGGMLRTVALAVGLAIVGAALIVATVLQPPADRITAGVRAGGIALGGLTVEEATAELRAIAPASTVTVTLHEDAGERTWTRTAAEVGLDTDPAALAQRAYAVGREGGWLARRQAVWRARFGAGVDLPVGSFDPAAAQRALEALAAEFAIAPQSADLRIGPDGKLEERTPVLGRVLDIDASLAALADVAAQGGRDVTLVTSSTLPRVHDLAGVTEAYKLITSAPVTLRWRDGQTWTASTDDLAKWARVEDRPNAVGDLVPTIVLDNAAVEAWLAPIAPVVAVAPSPARFGVEAGNIVLKSPAENGDVLDVPATIQRLIDAAYSDGRTNEVAVIETPPDSQDSALDALQATSSLAFAATSVAGMPEGIRSNVARAAAAIDGLAIPPDATFSLLERLGPVAPEAGYQMMFIEPLGTRDGLGGGVHQAATTLFRLVLRAGLPITERHAHPYRLGWIEPPVGLDATVAAPALDLKFVNDTGGFLMLLAAVDPTRDALTMSLYGLGPARSVRIEVPVVGQASAPPEPVTRAVAGLPAGARVQVGWAREGADVSVVRVVETSAGPRRETFVSHYAPAPDLFLVAR
ncbi:MAG: VanW family protein [Ardenticatenales bacterium]